MNDQRDSINSFLRTVDGLRSMKDLELSSLPYYDLEIKENSVVYCDPPYLGTAGYGTEKFDHERFWEWAEAVSEHSTVFVSEYTTLSDFFVPVWEMDTKITLSRKVKKATEKLFINVLN